MVRLDQAISVEPAHEIAAFLEDAGALDAAGVDVVLAHRRQGSASPLAFTLVAEFQLVEHAAMLRIKEHQRRAGVRQRPQQDERIPALRNIQSYGGALKHFGPPRDGPRAAARESGQVKRSWRPLVGWGATRFPDSKTGGRKKISHLLGPPGARRPPSATKVHFSQLLVLAFELT